MGTVLKVRRAGTSLRFILVCLLSTAACAALAAPVREYASPLLRTVMIELYTSEGCNSCPPAELYLNGFRRDADLWRVFVPLAFHVDYWDYLGWQDRFARPQHSRRQHDYARHHGRGTVYTPAFFVNGRPWRNAGVHDRPQPPRPEAGRLQLRVSPQGVELRFEPIEATARALQFNVAILGMGLQSAIEAGENAGRRARHDFVVLAHRSGTGDGLRWQTPLPRISEDDARAFAVAAWVSRPGSPVPLQAIGGEVPAAWFP